MTEEWRPVIGYEGLYEVSDLGRVRSLDRLDRIGRRQRGRILKQGVHAKSGHLLVSLWSANRGRTHDVHRLVGEAFIGPRPDGMETRHLDGDSSHNAAINLRYGTKGENNLDRVAHGTHHNSIKTECKWGHGLTPPNLRAAALLKGNRLCVACGREHSRAHAAGEPFDPERANNNYTQITQGVPA